MSDADHPSSEWASDIQRRLKQITQPLVDSLDSRLRKQVDDRVDARVDANILDRIAIMERAIGDLDRAMKELESRLARIPGPEADDEPDPGESPSEPSTH